MSAAADDAQISGENRSVQVEISYFLTFFGSQTVLFFLTTAPQSSQRNRPDLALTFDFPLRQLIAVNDTRFQNLFARVHRETDAGTWNVDFLSSLQRRDPDEIP